MSDEEFWVAAYLAALASGKKPKEAAADTADLALALYKGRKKRGHFDGKS